MAVPLCRPLGLAAGTVPPGRLLVDLLPVAPRLQPQQYRMESSPAGILLEGGSEAAIFWGLQTLAQILEQAGAWVPEFKIDDQPDFPQRGYMLDISRCKVPTMASLFRLVDQLAKLKINQFQLYMEHTFAFAAHERVWFDSSPLTAGEILDLDLYCRERFVELVPNFNSFGHLERWLQFAEYKHLAECPNGYDAPEVGHRDMGGILAPGPQSLAFLDALYAELLPNFSSRRFNIGCDETVELGQGRSKALCAAKGAHRVYFDFLLQLAALAEKHGRSVMFWGDIILQQPQLIAELPKDITALNWGYGAEHPFAEQTARFAQSGVPFYVCPGTSSWNALSGRTDNALGNIVNAAGNGERDGAVGLLLTDWGDNGHHQYPAVSWPAICAGAACSWCLAANRDADFAEAINRLWAGDSSGIVGSYVMEFGRLPNHFPEPWGHLAYHRALFASMDGPANFLKDITEKEIHAALDKTLALRGRLSSANARSEDASLILDELENGSLMVEAGLRKMLLMKGEREPVAPLLDLLRQVIGRYDRLWLARNRPGGLNESSGALRKSLAELQACAREK